jgi:hypothetical protein
MTQVAGKAFQNDITSMEQTFKIKLPYLNSGKSFTVMTVKEYYPPT